MEWISVEERLPNGPIPVLVFYAGFKIAYRCRNNRGEQGWFISQTDEPINQEVTHWAELEPPK